MSNKDLFTGDWQQITTTKYPPNVIFLAARRCGRASTEMAKNLQRVIDLWQFTLKHQN